MIERILFGLFNVCFLFVVILALVFAAINLFGVITGLIIFGLFVGVFIFLFYKTIKSKHKKQ